jgi:hypothetical protein
MKIDCNQPTFISLSGFEQGVRILILCFCPEAENIDTVTAGLLTYSPWKRLPIPFSSGTVAEIVPDLAEITAAGTVVDFHNVPFSSGHKKLCRKP